MIRSGTVGHTSSPRADNQVVGIIEGVLVLIKDSSHGSA